MIVEVAEKNLMPMQDGDVVSTFADIVVLENYFEYKPSISIKYGVDQFMDWYLTFYSSNK